LLAALALAVVHRPAPAHAQSTAAPTAARSTATPSTADPTVAPTAAPSTPAPSSAPTTPTPLTAAPSTADGNNQPWNRGVPTATREAARNLFLEGNRLFKIPLFVRAAEKYTAALARWQHPAFYFNLALAQLNLGEEVEAHDNLMRAVEHGDGALAPEELNEAQKQLHDLERQLGRLRISSPTPGAEVTLDGAPLFTAPGQHEGWSKAKAHEISAKHPAYLPRASRIVVAPGKLTAIDLSLVKLTDAEVTRWAVWKPWAVIASGAVIALASGGVHALSARNFHRYDDDFERLGCAMGGCMQDQIASSLRARLDRATLEQQLAVGGYIAGGALIATGAILAYLNRPHLAEDAALNQAGAAASIVPTISTDTLGVLVTVTH
jgi:hypothetical protein